MAEKQKPGAMTGGTIETGELRPVEPGEIVLAVSGPISAHRKDSSSPDTDYGMLASLLDAVVVGSPQKAGFSLMKRFEDAAALDIRQALHIVRTYPNALAYVSFSERIGLPLALLLRMRKSPPAHMMIAHRLNTSKKRALDKLAKWHHGVDRIVTLCSAQTEYARGFLPKASVFVRQGTDDRFYRPAEVEESDYVLAVGSESRDYRTLMTALAQTDLHLKVVSSSPWCRKKAALGGASGKVEILPRLDHAALRDLYRRAKLVVVPLHDVEYAAGLNGVLEAFCMNKPLIVSASRGISDYVSHMENAYVVPAGDVNAMAAALRIVDQTELMREHLKSGAARAVQEYDNLGGYARRLEHELRVMLAVREGAPLPTQES